MRKKRPPRATASAAQAASARPTPIGDRVSARPTTHRAHPAIHGAALQRQRTRTSKSGRAVANSTARCEGSGCEANARPEASRSLPAERRASGSWRRMAWVCSGPAVTWSTPQIERPAMTRASTAGHDSGGVSREASQIRTVMVADQRDPCDGSRWIVAGKTRNQQDADPSNRPHRGAAGCRRSPVPTPCRQTEDHSGHQDGGPRKRLGRAPRQPPRHRQQGALRWKKEWFSGSIRRHPGETRLRWPPHPTGSLRQASSMSSHRVRGVVGKSVSVVRVTHSS